MIYHIEAARSTRLVFAAFLLTNVFFLLYPAAARASDFTNKDDHVKLPLLMASQAPSSPTFVSEPAFSGAVGLAYTYTVQVSGHPEPTLTLNFGPEDMTINEGGTVRWTPSTAGRHGVTIHASNGVMPDADQLFEIDVAAAPTPPTITSSPLLSAAVGISYRYRVNVTGNPSPEVLLDPNTKPPGMAIDGDGLIQWTPASEGTYSVTVRAANGISPDAEQSFAIDVEFPIPPVITSTPLLSGTIGTLYSYQVQANGYPSPKLALDNGPDGMTLDEGGLVQWSPSTGGSYPVTVRASNGANPDAVQTFNLAIFQQPSITSAPDTRAVPGEPYTYQVLTTGYPKPTIWLDVGPDGMTINDDGLLQWMPKTTGAYAVTVRAGNGILPDAKKSFTIVVDRPSVVPLIISSPRLDGTVGDLYTYQIEATGYPTPTISLDTGPSGMTMDETGLIQWTPDKAGAYPVTVRASNGLLPDDEQSFNIVITPQQSAPAIISSPVTNATSGEPYFYRLAATGFPSPTYSLDSRLTGMTINDSGLIQWSPGDAGVYNVTARASNGVPPSSVQTFTIDVALADRIWDPDLDDRGASLVEASVPPGHGYYRLIVANWLNHIECGGKVNIFMDVLNSDGDKATDVKIRVSWNAGSTDVIYSDKPPGEFSWQFDMYAPAPAYDAQPWEYLADRVKGMGLGNNGDPWQHACYELTWQWTIMP